MLFKSQPPRIVTAVHRYHNISPVLKSAPVKQSLHSFIFFVGIRPEPGDALLARQLFTCSNDLPSQPGGAVWFRDSAAVENSI